MEGNLDVNLADRSTTATLEDHLDSLLGSVRDSLSPDFDREMFPTFLRLQFWMASHEWRLNPRELQVVDACSGKTLGVVRMVRLKSDDFRVLLRHFPTIDQVFYVGDPRAIARIVPLDAGRLLGDGQAVRSSTKDIVMYPYNMAPEFFIHVDLCLSDSYRLYVETHMIVDKAEYLFGSDAPGARNATLHHWREVLSQNEIREYNRQLICDNSFKSILM